MLVGEAVVVAGQRKAGRQRGLVVGEWDAMKRAEVVGHWGFWVEGAVERERMLGKEAAVSEMASLELEEAVERVRDQYLGYMVVLEYARP